MAIQFGATRTRPAHMLGHAVMDYGCSPAGQLRLKSVAINHSTSSDSDLQLIEAKVTPCGDCQRRMLIYPRDGQCSLLMLPSWPECNTLAQILLPGLQAIRTIAVR